MQGLKHWIQSYRLLVRWHLLKIRPWIAPVLLFQLATGVGASLGVGFLFPHISAETGYFLSTGAPTAMLLAVGLAVVPTTVTRAKEAGVIDYMMTLPVPRLAYLVADLTAWCILVLPVGALSLAASSYRYGFQVRIGFLLLPAVLLTLIAASSIGYLYGLLSPSTMVTSAVSNFAILLIFLLSPINFPADRLPGLLAALHEVLPIQAVAELIRSSLGGSVPGSTEKNLALVVAWTGASLWAVHLIMSRRD